MNPGKSLALVNIGLSILACVGYLAVRDYRHAIYWGAAAILTASVTL